ncbi:hypothetical protein EWM64_g5534 [Hericium alpestre]|uniref:F-box domain-containing protein n=1 Tax=Hericium alpestre TaxID=135208 RepID=A0A4Y9ZUD1_9AGAM|nr:hypothetical protein EWM64_g5534 [Hericium alpestre]
MDDLSRSDHPMAFKPETVPTDILHLLLEYLTDRRDLHSAALTSRCFNHVATPLLYRTLDSNTRTKWDDKELILRVGLVHSFHAELTTTVLSALALCTHLHSFTWVDDNYSSGALFIAFLDVLQELPLRAFTIRTYSDLGETAWARLNTFSGLQKIAIWCMDGPPRVLQGWADRLGSTLTELELGRCAGVPASILISVLSQLPLLRDLRLKGAPSAAIPDILTYLPNLVSLDTEYLGGGILRPPRPDAAPAVADGPHELRRPAGPTAAVGVAAPADPARVARDVYAQCVLNTGPDADPAPFPSLARAYARRDAATLSGQHDAADARGRRMPVHALSAAGGAVASVEHAIAKARNLRVLKLHVHWIPVDSFSASCGAYSPNSPSSRFGKRDAEALMLRKGSQIRTLSMGPQHYTGSWIRRLRKGGQYELVFEVVEDMIHDGWV